MRSTDKSDSKNGYKWRVKDHDKGAPTPQPPANNFRPRNDRFYFLWGVLPIPLSPSSRLGRLQLQAGVHLPLCLCSTCGAGGGCNDGGEHEARHCSWKPTRRKRAPSAAAEELPYQHSGAVCGVPGVHLGAHHLLAGRRDEAGASLRHNFPCGSYSIQDRLWCCFLLSRLGNYDKPSVTDFHLWSDWLSDVHSWIHV